jgi:hypothetical protein
MGNKKIKEILLSIGLNSTVHGPPSLLRSQFLAVRLLWMVSLIGSVCACSYVIFLTLANYVEYDVVTKIRTFSDPNPEFPAVRISNIDPFTTEAARTFLNDFLTTNGVNYETQIKFRNDQNYLYLYIKYITALIEAYNEFSDEKKKSMGNTYQGMVNSCSFNLQTKCTEADFVWDYDVVFGNSYRFNTGKNSSGHTVPVKRVSSTGSIYGLDMALFIGNENGRNPINVHLPSIGNFLKKFNTLFLRY